MASKYESNIIGRLEKNIVALLHVGQNDNMY
jgi:hypothetical protein